MGIAIPPTTKTITVEVSRFPKPKGDVLAKPTQSLQDAENSYIEHLQERILEETSYESEVGINLNKNKEYELARDYLSQGIFDYVNPLVRSLVEGFLNNSSNTRSIYETFQPIVNTELANGASPKDAAITAIKEGIQQLNFGDRKTAQNTLQEIDKLAGDNSPFSFFTTLLEPLIGSSSETAFLKDSTETSFLNLLLKSLVGRVWKSSIKPEFQEVPAAKEASRPESEFDWSVYNQSS